MRDCDEKLKKALMEILEKEKEKLEKELKQYEPHVFSEEFKKKWKTVYK